MQIEKKTEIVCILIPKLRSDVVILPIIHALEFTAWRKATSVEAEKNEKLMADLMRTTFKATKLYAWCDLLMPPLRELIAGDS